MNYIPRKGDIVFMDFSPHVGREQAGRRPALVLSQHEYNRSGLGLFCPITTKVKGYSFEVPLSEGMKTNGVVLSNHVKSFDWTLRTVDFVEKADECLIEEVLANLEILLFDE